MCLRACVCVGGGGVEKFWVLGLQVIKSHLGSLCAQNASLSTKTLMKLG